MRKLLSNIVRKVNILVVVLLILSYASVFIHPQYFWPLQLVGALYPLLLFLNIAFIIFWLVKRRWFFLCSFIAVLIGYAFFARYVQLNLPFQKKKEPISHASSFKIISYNVRLFNLYKWVKTDNTANGILSFINIEDPGILCLQEFYTRGRGGAGEKDILKRMGNNSFSHINYSLRKSNLSNFGIATFSKYPIVGRGEIIFQNSFNQCIYTDIKIHSDTIRVYNVHLQSYRFLKQDYMTIDSLKFKYDARQMLGLKGIYYRLKTSFQKRAYQSDTVSRHMKSSPFPVILCGDFNDSPISYTYQTVSANMKDAFLESGSGFGNTYFGKFPSYRIDYILFDHSFKAFGYRSPKLNFSDHYPVICEIKLQPE